MRPPSSTASGLPLMYHSPVCSVELALLNPRAPGGDPDEHQGPVPDGPAESVSFGPAGIAVRRIGSASGPSRWSWILPVLLAVAGRASAEGLPDSCRRLWADPATVARIERGIEAHRKGDLTIEISGPDGGPASGVRIEVEQTTHAFLFGCNLFALGQLGTPEKNRAYEEAFLGLFNFATIPFYWDALEPEEGRFRFAADSAPVWRRPPPDLLLDWCRAHGVTPKGHPLFWQNWNPAWLPADAEAYRKAYLRRFEAIARRYADEIPVWDVVNEALACKKEYPLFDKQRMFVDWAFAQVRPLFARPGHTLMINETGHKSHQPGSVNPYYALLRALKDRGCEVDAVGLQFHWIRRELLEKNVRNPRWSPAALLDVYERFAGMGKPLYITEISIPSDGPDGPAVQAETARNFYRLWFSVSRMAGITWWNLGDSTIMEKNADGRAGILHDDLTPKPAYRALEDLIRREWTTRTSGATDAHGRFTFRGFGGKYEVRIPDPSGDGGVRRIGAEVKEGKAETVRLDFPAGAR